MIQLQCLNYLINSKDSQFIESNNLSSEFFSDYVPEYSYIADHLNRFGNIPDVETFLQKFPKFDLIQVSESPEYLLSELYKDKNNRLMAKTFNNIRQLLIDNKIEEAKKLYLNSTQSLVENVAIKPVDIIRDNSRYADYIERSQDYKKYYVKTGFPELDSIIGGWDRIEEFATIVARNGIGKSWILLKTAIEAAKEGLTVGLYSGEMSARMVGYRADSLIGHLSNIKMIHGNLDIQNDYKRYIDSIPENIPGKLLVFTPDMIDGPVGVNALRSFIEKEHLDILCVDQYSLLNDDRGAKNPVDRASNISRDLKQLQSLKHIPIIAVSQQNRSSTENGFNTALISQSDMIGQNSTQVIFIDQKDGILTLHLVKARFGASNKKIQYAFDFDRGIFTYIPSEESNNNIVKPVEEYETEPADGENVF